MSVFDFSYFRAPLDEAAPYFRRWRYGTWETADADGNWRVIMDGLDRETTDRLVEILGPSFHYCALHEGSESTYWRVVHDWHPDQPPELHEAIWIDGRWQPGPFPSENEWLRRRRVPPPCLPGPNEWFTRAQQYLWEESPPIKPSGDQTMAQAENMAVGVFQRVCELEGAFPLPDERLIRAAIELRHDFEREQAERERGRIKEAEAAIAKIKRGWEADPADYWSVHQAAADEVPARGLIPDEVWWLAVRALTDRVMADRGLPEKMSSEIAMLTLHVHPCTGEALRSS